MKSFLLVWLLMIVLGLFTGCAKTTEQPSLSDYQYVHHQQNAATIASTMISPLR
jgi:hypothetical protein